MLLLQQLILPLTAATMSTSVHSVLTSDELTHISLGARTQLLKYEHLLHQASSSPNHHRQKRLPQQQKVYSIGRIKRLMALLDELMVRAHERPSFISAPNLALPITCQSADLRPLGKYLMHLLGVSVDQHGGAEYEVAPIDMQSFGGAENWFQSLELQARFTALQKSLVSILRRKNGHSAAMASAMVQWHKLHHELIQRAEFMQRLGQELFLAGPSGNVEALSEGAFERLRKRLESMIQDLPLLFTELVALARELGTPGKKEEETLVFDWIHNTAHDVAFGDLIPTPAEQPRLVVLADTIDHFRTCLRLGALTVKQSLAQCHINRIATMRRAPCPQEATHIIGTQLGALTRLDRQPMERLQVLLGDAPDWPTFLERVEAELGFSRLRLLIGDISAALAVIVQHLIKDFGIHRSGGQLTEPTLSQLGRTNEFVTEFLSFLEQILREARRKWPDGPGFDRLVLHLFGVLDLNLLLTRVQIFFTAAGESVELYPSHNLAALLSPYSDQFGGGQRRWTKNARGSIQGGGEAF